MHIILHYCGVWILVVNLVIVNVWVLALLIEAWGQAVVPSNFTIEQLIKSQVVRGNVNS